MIVFKDNNIKQNLDGVLTLHFLTLKAQMFGRQKTKLDEYEDKKESWKTNVQVQWLEAV